jgi:exopolyphosphatase/guanosine-5'-triphosphate,3'-diphosphate pyrophosphatase
MSEERIAIIDMGTNTFHLLLAKWTGDETSIFYKEKFPVKIGSGGISQGIIAPAAYERALKALSSFKHIMEKHQVSRVYAAATSAVRNASNGLQLAEEIYHTTGIRVNIISGDKEAELIYRGVKCAMDLGSDNSMVMDIGGGSVEFIICNAKKIFWKGSFEIGAQRLVDLFHKSDPVSREELHRLIVFLDEKLAPVFEAASFFKPATLVGSSGSFDTLASIDIHSKGLSFDIENEKEYAIPVKTFETIYQQIIHKNKEQRMLIPGMIEMRVDMIVVACALTSHVIQRLSIKNIRVSTYALKEGILSKLIGRETI